MDNRTPPPGIEVIGELPPGVPWWDAEELGLLSNRRDKLPLLLLCVVGTVILSLEMIPQISGGDEFLRRAGIAYIAFMLVAIMVWVGLLWRRIAVVISRDELQRRVLPLGGVSVPRKMPLSGAVNPRMLEQFSNGAPYHAGVKFNIAPGDEYDPAASLSSDFLLADGIVIERLLNYRIAKAKGETPPPFALPEDYISSLNGSAG